MAAYRVLAVDELDEREDVLHGPVALVDDLHTRP
jgi:hypothetical protein